MRVSAEDIGDDWIAYARFPSPTDNAPEQVQADAMSMFELSQDQPEMAWDVIRYVVGQYSDEDLFAREETEAKRVIGLVAAGPLEDLLGFHGADFIDRIEAEALRDQRMAWALGGMYQFLMSDEVWARTRKVAVERTADGD